MAVDRGEPERPVRWSDGVPGAVIVLFGTGVLLVGNSTGGWVAFALILIGVLVGAFGLWSAGIVAIGLLVVGRATGSRSGPRPGASRRGRSRASSLPGALTVGAVLGAGVGASWWLASGDRTLAWVSGGAVFALAVGRQVARGKLSKDRS